MTNLRGFLWSMGRCGTKAIVETINDCTSADAPSWVDTPRLVDSSNYFLQSYPRPFVLTLHYPQHCASYEALLGRLRDRPIVLTVRDPISNLKSYAKIFLNSYISRRIDVVTAHASSGKTVVETINPSAFDEWVLPMTDYRRHLAAMEASPHKVIDITDLDESRFVETMTALCDFLDLERTKPIVWQGVANRECDNFFISYVRMFSILGRKMELRFSRWNGHWSEQGLVTLGALRGQELDALIGAGESLYVHLKADQLLCAGSIEREREGFSRIIAEESARRAITTQVIRDYNVVQVLVHNELEALQRILIRKFETTYLESVEEFLRAQPGLQRKWSDMSASKAA